MAHYNANQIIENIEQVLEEEALQRHDPLDASLTSRFRERRSEELNPSTFRKLERAQFKMMRVHQAVDKVPEGTRFRFLKRVFARFLRLVSGPQSTYNFHNLQSLQMISQELDHLRDRIRLLESGAALPFGVAQMEGSGVTRLGKIVTQHLGEVQNNVRGISSNMRGMSESLTQMLDNLSAVSARLNQLNLSQRDTHNDVSAARVDLGRLWTELGLVYESVDTRAEDLWKGIDERDSQLLMNTEATQQLHNQVSSLETNIKELRARLLVLTEQLTIHQEMLETVQQEVTEVPRRERPARPAAAELVPAAGEHEPSHFMTEARVADGTSSLIQRQLDLAYLRFQRQFRGDEGELRARQREYINLVTTNLRTGLAAGEKPRLLDLACGDGIFVELAGESGWTVEGVDINEAMVKQARSRNLPITQGDAFLYLESAQPKSFDVISMFQFIEHLPPSMMMRLLKSTYRALKPNGLILIETINPHTLKALHWFHLDLTHERLVFPEMLQLLAETAGFFSVEWKGINPVSESERLKVEGNDTEKANLRKLNDFLFGAQDYYFLARRPSGESLG